MKRKQIIIAVLGAGVVLLCVWSVLRLTNALKNAKEAQLSRDNVKTQLDGMYTKNPFPSRVNIMQVDEDSKKLEKWTNDLRLMLTDDSKPASLSPQLFMQTLWDNMRTLSHLPSGAGRLASDDFAFGFDRYRSGADGRAPEPEDVPKLSVQLKMIDRICRELSNAGIITLISVKREQFESDAAKPSEQTVINTGRVRRRATATGTGTNPEVAGAGDGHGVLGHSVAHHFVFEFLARQNNLMDVLNRLAEMDLFVVVTDLAVAKSADDIKAAPIAKGPGEGKSPQIFEKDSNKQKDEAPPDAMQRVLSGPLVDPPLKVTIGLDVHMFQGV